MNKLSHPAPDTQLGFDFERSTANHAEHDGMEYQSKRHARHTEILAAIQLRTGTDRLVSPKRFSGVFIIEQAAQRYFALLDKTQNDLKNHFSAEEIRRINNAECTPIWDTRSSLATMVADDMRVSNLSALKKGSFEHTLMSKLAGLTELENIGLADACERQLRGHDNPLL